MQGRHPTTTPRLVGRYTLLARIGSGGMAEVYRATPTAGPSWSRHVAIKCMRADLAGRPELLAQFRGEAELASMVEHAHLGGAIEYIESPAAIVFPLWRGADLLRILQASTRIGQRPPPGVIVRIIADAASALGALHAFRAPDGRSGWVHSDVSPANIVVTHEGEIKLIDLGVAHRPQAGAVQLARRGKLGYFAPETVRHGLIEPRSEVFSLATVLWESLTLRRLFKVADDVETLRNIAEVRVAQRFERHDWIPDGLAAVIRRALAPNPAERQRDAFELQAELLGWLGREAGVVTDREVGALCRQLVPAPLEEELGGESGAEGASSSDAHFDLSGLEAMIDALDQAAPDADLSRLIDGTHSWLPEPVREALSAPFGVGASEERTAPEILFDAFGSDRHRPERLDPFDPFTFPALLCSLALRRFTGTLNVRSQRRRKHLHFIRGEITHITSNLASERLGSRLAREGVIEAEARIRALALQRERGLRIGEALVAAEPACAAAVGRALATELQERLIELLGWPSGEVTFETFETPTRARTPRRTACAVDEVLPQVVAAAWAGDELLSALEPWRGHRVFPLPTGVPHADADLSERHRRLISAPDLGSALSTASSPAELARTVYLGLVTFRVALRQPVRALTSEPRRELSIRGPPPPG